MVRHDQDNENGIGNEQWHDLTDMTVTHNIYIYIYTHYTYIYISKYVYTNICIYIYKIQNKSVRVPRHPFNLSMFFKKHHHFFQFLPGNVGRVPGGATSLNRLTVGPKPPGRIAGWLRQGGKAMPEVLWRDFTWIEHHSSFIMQHRLKGIQKGFTLSDFNWVWTGWNAVLNGMDLNGFECSLNELCEW